MLRSTRLRALAAATPQSRLLGDGDAFVSGITYDSRATRTGDLFAALRGADFDGHAFIRDAQARGAAGFLVEDALPLDFPQILVSDTRAALPAVSAAFFAHPSRELGVIGITGTDGKTTTSYLIDHILKSSGLLTGMIGTVAIRIGDQEILHPSRQTTPESSDIQRLMREMADAHAAWAILEATSHGLALHRLDCVRFRVGAVTNVTQEHLDFHGSVERYRRAKGKLLERVAEEQGIAVVNADDAGARDIARYAGAASVLTYSATGAAADLRADDVRFDATGSLFAIDLSGTGREDVQLPLLGDFNVANALCASAVAIAVGVPLHEIALALSDARAIPGRTARVDVGQPFSVIIDYAHTPQAMEKIMRLLRLLHPEGRLITVFGSAGERDIEKRPIQGAIAARLGDICVITSEDPRFEDADAIIAQIADGAIAAGAVPGETLHRRTDRRDAIQLAMELASPGDCVLLAGKGHEASIIWGREKIPWDETGVARDILLDTGYPETNF